MSGQAAKACRGRGFLQVVHIIESRVWVVLTCDRLHLTWCGEDGLWGHLKRRLELILPLLLTRPYLRRGTAPKRPVIGILLGPQLGCDNPILLRVEWIKNAADIDSELAETLSASPAQP